MKAGVYLRVSTDKQTVENQRAALAQLCTARDWEADWREEVESGAKKRPVLEALCTDARRGKVGAIVVWAIDRLGRKKVESAHRLRDLAHAGVRVVSYQETWLDQPEGPTRALLVDVFTWVAEGERARLIERTKAGLDIARAKLAKGQRIGKTGAAALGRPNKSGAALLAAAAECQRVEGEYFKVGKLVWMGKKHGENVARVAERHGLSESTLRRFLRKVAAKLDAASSAEPVKKGI